MVASVSPAPSVARDSSGGGLEYRPGLDAVRGIAVLLVMLHHTGHPAFKHLGVLGVCLFFSLSGFLITSILRTERESTGRIRLLSFYARRARRLLPALILFVAVVSMVMLASGRGEEVPRDVIPVLGYHANFYPPVVGGLGWMSHAWSLAVEEQFYAVWPLVVLLLVPWISRMIIAAVVVVVVVRVLDVVPTAMEHTVAVADSLLLGCLLACVKWRPPNALVVVAATGLVLWAASPLRDIIGTNANVLVALGVAVVVGGAAQTPWEWRPLIGLGLISYGVYLWHFPLFMTGDTFDIPLVAFLPLAGLAVLMAYLSYRCVEQPIRTMDWSRLKTSAANSHLPFHRRAQRADR